MLHRNARRDFSVQIKSAGRRSATIIPPREPKPARTRQEALAQPGVEAPPDELPRVKPAQAGRVLPNLIVPEAPPAAIEAAPEPKARRPYTRRAKPVPAMPVETMTVETPPPMAAPVPSPVVAPVTGASSERKRASGRDGVQQLALGQRWKRRLSRWSR